MTKLFQELGMSGNGASGDTKTFLENASRQGFKMSVPDFFRFMEMAKGRDMGAVVQELRQSGAIDEKQYQSLKQKASGFLNMIKMVSGQ